MSKACESCKRRFEPRHDMEAMCATCRNLPIAETGSPFVDGPVGAHVDGRIDGIVGSIADGVVDGPFSPPVPVHNRVYRANLSGGIIGWLGASSKHALEQVCKDANVDGQEVVFVLTDTVNFLQYLVYTAILLLTLFLWCPVPGYLVVTRPRSLSRV